MQFCSLIKVQDYQRVDGPLASLDFFWILGIKSVKACKKWIIQCKVCHLTIRETEHDESISSQQRAKEP